MRLTDLQVDYVTVKDENTGVESTTENYKIALENSRVRLVVKLEQEEWIDLSKELSKRGQIGKRSKKTMNNTTVRVNYELINKTIQHEFELSDKN